MQVKVPGCWAEWAEWAEISGGLPVGLGWAWLGSVGLGCSCVTSDLLSDAVSVVYVVRSHPVTPRSRGHSEGRPRAFVVLMLSIAQCIWDRHFFRQNSKFKGRHR